MANMVRLVLLMTILCAPMTSALYPEIILGVAVVVVGVGVGVYFAPTMYYVHFTESCSHPWVKPNMTAGLQSTLQRRVFGQHLVTKTIPKVLGAHLKNTSPKKALVLSFNGGTGTGKNFVSKIIAEHIFKKGLESDHVHLIMVLFQ